MYPTPEDKATAKRRDKMKYQFSEKGRAKRAAYMTANMDRAKEWYARYRLTDGYREAQSRYAASEQGKAAEAAYQAWVKATQPIRIKARAAVSAAMRAGRIVRPGACESCGVECKPDAHHYLGYEPSRWLSVWWLCRRCHKAIH